MGRLAIFIDGGHVSALEKNCFGGVSVDYGKLASEIAAAVDARTVEPVELLRTFYYNCPPYQGSKPTQDEARRYGAAQRFYRSLERLPRFAVRLGQLKFRGLDAAGKPIFQQKGVDLQLGLDFAVLAGKNAIQHAAVLSGDADFVPAVNVAKQEGVCVWHVHGPLGSGTYASQLWDSCDERIELTSAFVTKIQR